MALFTELIGELERGLLRRENEAAGSRFWIPAAGGGSFSLALSEENHLERMESRMSNASLR